MIPPRLVVDILRLYHVEKWRVGTIAAQLRLHHSTVRRVLAEIPPHAGRTNLRPSLVDPFVPFIIETLREYPSLRASRLYAMVCERGYPGRPDHFRTVVARYRPRPVAEAYLRLRTLPGEQAQADWGHFGKLVVGRALRALMAFVLVLSWSRRTFLRFFLGCAMPNFLRGHVEAFSFFGHVPRSILYDNLKSAVLERVGDAIRFHPTLLELAAHYRFDPRPVAPARGNEKGRVERAIRYARDNFFAARSFRDLGDLNTQALEWCEGPAAERLCPEDRSRTVRDAFEIEKTHMLALPDNPFPSEERLVVHVGRTPYVRFDLNDYSVPSQFVRQSLVALATLETVRVVHGNDVVATHERSFDRGAQIEDPAHVADLVARKREARELRGMDRLHHSVPSSQDLFRRLAKDGANLGSATNALCKLLDAHGAATLEEAIRAALDGDSAHVSAVRHWLDHKRRARGLPPALPVSLSDNPRVRDLRVEPHPLTDYEQLLEDKPDDPEDESET